ncbi:MAG: redoxin family protein [Lachnospiraceae bacterium]|nr:redoxin family protein [Lachnospiraceae bacterium]
MGNKIKNWWNEHRPAKRRLIQLYSALLYNAHLKGFVSGSIYTGNTKALCVPGLNCYSCPGAVGACPLGSMQAALASSGEHIGFYMIGILLLFGLIFARTICGFLCPFGLLQELIHKLPTQKLKKSRVTGILSWLKYLVLILFAVAIPLWYGLKRSMAVPGFCKYICPAGTLEGAVVLLSNPHNRGYFSMLGVYFTLKFIIMLLVFLLCIFIYRAFCRFLCPLGAIYGLFSRLSIIGFRVEPDKCSGCGLCVSKCKMDVKRVGDHECIHCGNCADICPGGAISFTAGRFTLKSPGKGFAAAALGVLLIALLLFNLPKSSVKSEPAEKAAAVPAVEAVEGSSQKEETQTRAETIQPLEEEAQTQAETVENPEEEAQTQAEALQNPEKEAQTQAETVENPEEEAQTTGDVNYESDAPEGYEVGQQLKDFTVQCLDGSTFHLKENRGKVTFINLWATYCGPCVEEMPYFNELYHEHEGDVAMLALHAARSKEDKVNSFLSDKGWDIPFAIDDDNETVFGIVNGSDVLPQTIVLNRKGEVIYNTAGSVSAELLKQLYEEASK